MPDQDDIRHRQALVRAVLILLVAILFLVVALMPTDAPLLRFLSGPVGTVIEWTFAAWFAASTIRGIVQWINKRDDPRSAKRPPDDP
jgi:hypothetical protein